MAAPAPPHRLRHHPPRLRPRPRPHRQPQRPSQVSEREREGNITVLYKMKRCFVYIKSYLYLYLYAHTRACSEAVYPLLATLNPSVWSATALRRHAMPSTSLLQAVQRKMPIYRFLIIIFRSKKERLIYTHKRHCTTPLRQCATRLDVQTTLVAAAHSRPRVPRATSPGTLWCVLGFFCLLFIIISFPFSSLPPKTHCISPNPIRV